MSWLRKLIEYNLIARMTMLASVLMSWRCAEWFMNLEDPTMQQSAFVSVIMGVIITENLMPIQFLLIKLMK